MRVLGGLAEFTAAKGEQLGYSDWHEVTQEQVDTFADATATTSGSTWTPSAPPPGRSGPPSRTAS